MVRKNKLPDSPQQSQLRQVAQALAKDIKTESALNKVLNEFVKMTVEAALWLEQFNLIQGVGAKTVQIVRQATTTQDQIKLLQPYQSIYEELAVTQNLVQALI